MKRPNVLYLTPTLPHLTGNGSSIRAGATLEALSALFNVYVLHADLWGVNHAAAGIDFVQQRSAQYVCHAPEKGEVPVSKILSEQFKDVHFDAVHAFRLHMARAALAALQHFKATQPCAVLDLDADEYRSASGCLRLREEAGDTLRVAQERRELARLVTMQQLVLPRFAALLISAREECEDVRKRCPAVRLTYLPNAIFPQALAAPADSSSRPFTILFVGTFTFLPNEDAILHFYSHILPLIRQNCSIPIRLRIVGAYPKPCITDLAANDPSVEVFANVPDLEPYYAEADLAVVPLRAGSGTRIKILEAFSFHRPVVSTSIGCEGLGVTDGRQLLIADQPEAFANACRRLIQDRELRTQIAECANAWVLANHSIANMQAVLHSVYQPLLESQGCALVAHEREGASRAAAV